MSEFIIKQIFMDNWEKFLKISSRCNSRFCNTCGVKYFQDRVLSMVKKSIRYKHRDIVFTISNKL